MRQLIRHAASVLVLVVLVAPLAAMAQQAGKVYRSGYLSPRPGIELPEEAPRSTFRLTGFSSGGDRLPEWRPNTGTEGRRQPARTT
jgi:hypothetical protein